MAGRLTPSERRRDFTTYTLELVGARPELGAASLRGPCTSPGQRRNWGNSRLGYGDSPGFSYATNGTLRFNRRAVMLEPSLLEYVVVQEFVHLRVKYHSPDF